MSKSQLPKSSYQEVLKLIKKKVYEAQYRSFQAVNSELIKLYWEIGEIIASRQKKEKWGDSTVEKLAQDLQTEFPGIKGFSKRNVWRMKQLYETFENDKFLSQLVTEIPWGHNVLILTKCKDPLQREFYIKMTIKNGWSRSILEDKIADEEFERWALKQDNYKKRLPATISEKAEFVAKDDYNLDFLLLKDRHKEKELEQAITENIVQFLSTMGGDFAFLGRQYPLRISEKEYFVDLLFYHRRIKSLIAVELKVGEFDARDADQMGMYLAALDKYDREKGENPSIGIIICKKKNREVVDLSLQFITKPIGVATYRTYKTKRALPENIKKYLPSPEELKNRLGKVLIKKTAGDHHAKIIDPK